MKKFTVGLALLALSGLSFNALSDDDDRGKNIRVPQRQDGNH
jgi:hypothetical protein